MQHWLQAAYHYWKPFEAYAVERILAAHKDAVIDLGEVTRCRRTRSSSPGSRLPWPLWRTSFSCCRARTRRSRFGVLTRRRPPPKDFDWHRHFVTHRSNRVLAKLVVYTGGQTAEQTCEVIHRRLARATS